MASKAAIARLPMAAIRPSTTITQASSRRAFSAMQHKPQQPFLGSRVPRSQHQQQGKMTFQQMLRRSYVDAASPKPKKKRGGFLRWTWRVTWVSALGGLGYVGWIIYTDRQPMEQVIPDPSKKTLVILGESSSSAKAFQVLCGSTQAILYC